MSASETINIEEWQLVFYRRTYGSYKSIKGTILVLFKRVYLYFLVLDCLCLDVSLLLVVTCSLLWV